MIIEAKIRAGYRSMGDYLKDQGENEETRLVYMSDPDAHNLDEAFQNMWAVSCNGKAEKPLLHFSINPDSRDRKLTDQEAISIAHNYMQRCNQRIGNHQFVVVEHIKKGRQHFHVVVNRISLKTGKAVSPGKYYFAKMNCAREMEKELGLRSPFSPNEKELNNAKALAWSIEDIDAILYEAFKTSKNGKELVAALAKKGFTLLKGRPNRKGEPAILIRDTRGAIYRATASLMRSDIAFRKNQLMQKLGKEIDTLSSYQPRTFRLSRGFGIRPSRTRASLKQTLSPAPRKKKSSGGQSGGAMGAAAPFFKVASKIEAAPFHKAYEKSVGRGNGPERRRKNLWVPVERREQRPKN